MRRDILVANVGPVSQSGMEISTPICPGWVELGWAPMPASGGGKPMVSVAKPACVIPWNALNDTRDSEQS